jgi:hypothetical protein
MDLRVAAITRSLARLFNKPSTTLLKQMDNKIDF